MAPFVIIDETPDFGACDLASPATKAIRTLLLSPPSLSSRPEALTKVLAGYERLETDIQMLDRLAAGLTVLPSETYDLILLLSDVDGSQVESQKLLDRNVIANIFGSLRPGGQLKSQDGKFGAISSAGKTEAILAGMMANDTGDGMMKPHEADTGGVVMLKPGKNRQVASVAFNENKPVEITNQHERGSEQHTEPNIAPATPPAGVGLVDFDDDFDIPIITGEDDELIDEYSLLTEEDKTQGIIQPVECRPKAGKRRRACKDCTCGLKEKLEAEDTTQRDTADKALNTLLRLDADDLTELDFTIQGKVGSCGNCALGDAFRCAGCPYIGLPAFKPGEEVRLINNDVQL